jgi:endonuclease YncB( thermonuclease family)
VLKHASLPASLRCSVLGPLSAAATLGQLAALLAALVLAGCAELEAEPADGGAEPAGLATVRVTKHTDGDTLWLSDIGKVRLIGVDTPEVYGGVECYGHEASAFMERTVPLGSEVRYRLGVDERDRYGRALAYVWLRDGRFLNRLLVARGYAQPMTVPPNVEYEDVFVKAAARAREAGRGLWGRVGCAAP